MIYRNILQPAMRKAKLPRWAAIVGQSLLYSVPYGIANLDIGIALCLFIVSLVNGWLAAKYRSLWPAFANIALLSVFIH